MISEKQQKSEKEFNEWIDSIRFIDKNGNLISSKLTKDDSEDPEGDRD